MDNNFLAGDRVVKGLIYSWGCGCKDIKILCRGDDNFKATERFCLIHGYQNDCYICNPGICTTEICRNCSKKLRSITQYKMDMSLRRQGGLDGSRC